jgi:hypothetical protein
MKKIVVICKGVFGKEMVDYLTDIFSTDSGYGFDRIQDLFPDAPFMIDVISIIDRINFTQLEFLQSRISGRYCQRRTVACKRRVDLFRRQYRWSSRLR